MEGAIVFNNQTKKDKTLGVDSIFIFCGLVPNTEFLKKIGVDIDDNGHVKVDERLMTSIPGIFAAGDITGKLKRIAWAVGEGCLAAFSAYKWMKNQYFSK